jgi:hypothetical protein
MSFRLYLSGYFGPKILGIGKFLVGNGKFGKDTKILEYFVSFRLLHLVIHSFGRDKSYNY